MPRILQAVQCLPSRTDPGGLTPTASPTAPPHAQPTQRCSAGPNQDSCAQQGPASASEPASGETSSRRGTKERKRAAARAESNQEQPSRGSDASKHGDTSRVGASPGRRAGRKVWACAQCGVTAETLEGGKLKECSACRSVRYCGRECQTADWPAHKATCKRMRATCDGV
jgi:hypothetical protein